MKHLKCYECVICDKILLVGRNNIDLIENKKIIFLKTYLNYILIASSNREYFTSDPLIYFENYLPSYFFRINNSVIINLNYIDKIRKGDCKCTVELSTGIRFTVSRRRIRNFMSFVRNNLNY